MVYERSVGEFCSQISIIYKDENKIKIIKKFPDGNNKTLTALSGIDKFRVETHHVIVDKFCSELDKRINVYSVVVENCLFLTRLLLMLRKVLTNSLVYIKMMLMIQ